MTLPEETEITEKRRIIEAVLDSGGKRQAARKLGISHMTVYNKLRRWNLQKANARELITALHSVNNSYASNM